jgi:methylmalonyl-CoA mutase N-terminal domain/subunit
MRQYAGFGTAEETNERFHYRIDEGQTGLSTATYPRSWASIRTIR